MVSSIYHSKYWAIYSSFDACRHTIVIVSKRVLFASASKDEPKLEAAFAQGDFAHKVILLN
ncbi:MAG: hypothetical protein AB1728_10515 [Bacteroidota bacterium]